MRISRRGFIGAAGVAVGSPLAAWSSATPASGWSAGSADVIIVGGGYSGMAAAHQLVGAGKSVIVLEARERVGGRAFTQRVPGGGWVDNGAQWIGPAQTRILALAREFDVETFPTYQTGKSILEYQGNRVEFSGLALEELLKVPIPPEDLAEFALAVDKFSGLAETVPPAAPWNAPNAAGWDSQTVATWMNANMKSAGARFLFTTAVKAYFSVEPADFSFLHFLFYVAAAGGFETLEESSLAWRFDGGVQQIPDAIAAGLGDAVKLRSPVRRIDQTGRKVVVTTDDRRYEGSRVIVAMAPPMAARIDYHPILPASRDQYTQHLAMGSTIKAHAVYRTPFWREQGLNGQILTQSPVNVTYDNSPPGGGPGILVAFFEGNPAREWADRPEAAVKAEILRTLVNYFGPRAAHPKYYYQVVWANEEWSRGCYCGMPATGTWTEYRDALRTPVGRVHWAGTETSTEWAQYMEGAVASGQRAASEVQAEL
ncbi:flavin monoamine oxidase family protein [Kitasatospora sp. NPDC052896]|uniref:flavin monoamine oxidase family protein n=1 Tax=Kitasatospora sp. NPDC052896 TaxID=3364061 RepID=UPI0037C70AC0